ncbi:MAG: cysteine--tRNA ligase [Clostridiales bacterium]|nr:cysteine--tRNA ligase [Clostridiales bacterium]
MLKVYNTLSRKKEDFVAIDENVVRMYSCGPTVYSYAHIGNLRTYIFMDLIRKVLKYNGLKLKGVLNITDVGHLIYDSDSGEDKMALAAKKEQKSPMEIAEYYTKVFFDDFEKLNIERPEIIAKATDHIGEMIEYVSKLLEKGIAYETSDGIYFDISKFENYGLLSGINLDDQIAGARVEVNTEKRHPADFALWKKAEPNHIMQWESPWGMGYPGWHIECSVMSQKYLGTFFDIHSGGVDHIPIHHENEIAQNEALTGEKSVNYWLHGEFMLVDGGKMSKSLGNVYTISQLEEKGYSPLDFRFFCLNAHYRKKLNFTFEGMTAAKVSRERLLASIYQHKIADTVKTDEEVLNNYRQQFVDAINDDINIPLALGVLFTMVKEPKSIDIYNLCLEFDKVLGLSLDQAEADKDDTAKYGENVAKLIEQRAQAKKLKNFALADEIRAKINALGFNIADTRDGVKVTKI